MKNTVDAAAFYKAMTALLDIPAKSSISVLREIKVAFTGDQCVLSATDLNTWMSVTLPASGDSFDFVFQNSANIQKVCRHYDGALELELQQRGDESFLTMRSGSKGGEFPVYDTKDCPEWPEIEVKQTYAANAANILACVKQVKYAVGSRNTRPEYQGVLFQNKHIWAVEDIARPAVMTVGWMLKRRFLSVFRRWNRSKCLALRIYRSAWQITGSCSRMNTFACLQNVS